MINLIKSLNISFFLMVLAITNISNAQSIGIKFNDKHYIFYDEETDLNSRKLTPKLLRIQLSQLGTEMLRQKETSQRVLHIINSVYSLLQGRKYIWMNLYKLESVESVNPQNGDLMNDEDIDYATVFND